MGRPPKLRDDQWRTQCAGCKEWKSDDHYPKTSDGRPNGRCYACRAADQRLRDAPKLARQRIERAHLDCEQYLLWLSLIVDPGTLSDADFKVWFYLKKHSSDTPNSS